MVGQLIALNEVRVESVEYEHALEDGRIGEVGPVEAVGRVVLVLVTAAVRVFLVGFGFLAINHLETQVVTDAAENGQLAFVTAVSLLVLEQSHVVEADQARLEELVYR